MKNLIRVSERRAPKRSKRRLWLALLVFIPLLLSGPKTPGQQPAAGASKDLIPPSATGKSEVGAVKIPSSQPAIDLGTVDSVAILRSARIIFVRSHSVLVKGAVVEEKLQKRPEFQQFGLAITRDASAADLVLELRHDLFTKYVYTAIDPRTQILVASGKLSSLGGTVADKVAKRFLKQMGQARSASDTSEKN